ncbi:hypothetical protein C7N83_10760 [Neisseria iguanae]|uniref:Uncharacterized protein n=1 Tax=Neisseria iguanae TaxID=90242 RepID=A0A2P7TYE6_9NEIS|nr:hypothetical protein C7N83_10760 [Neisseria iguanae]
MKPKLSKNVNIEVEIDIQNTYVGILAHFFAPHFSNIRPIRNMSYVCTLWTLSLLTTLKSVFSTKVNQTFTKLGYPCPLPF